MKEIFRTVVTAHSTQGADILGSLAGAQADARCSSLQRLLKTLRFCCGIVLALTAVSLITSKSALAQTPSIVVSGLPATPLIGEEVCTDISFTNTSATTGFGPYLLLVLDPELASISADFVDIAPPTTQIGVFDVSGVLVDPITGLNIMGNAGGSAWLLRYPVGSIDQGQPALVMEVCTSSPPGSEIGVARGFSVTPGFEFGDTTVGTNGPITASATSSTITPQIARIQKANSAPESERPPGPSHPFLYQWTVDISEGVTLDNVVLTDNLPAQIQWTGDPITLSAPSGVGCALSQSPNSPSTAGGTAEVTCSSILGTGASDDVAVAIPVYITDVLNEAIPDSLPISNTVDLDYDFQGTGFSADSSSALTAVHAALQKRVAGTGLPGGTLTYSINFQLTDFPDTPTSAGANTFIVEDILPDGLAYDDTIALVVDGATVAINPSVVPNPSTGETALTWDIADAVGGTLANGANGSLTFRTNVLLSYANGDPVLASDVFTNQPELTYTLTSGGSGTDDSSISQSINPNVANKTIFSPNPLPPALEPGEEVVFELSLDIPAGNTADVVFVDFLPRPVFRVSDFNAASDIQILPPFSGLTPAISTRTSDNSVTIDFGDISSTAATALVVQITARLVGDPFADSLFLTNLLQTSYTNTNGDTISDLQAAGATVGAPSLVITKGVIEAANPRATIVPAPPADPSAATADSNANGVDAADDITFLITVENVGSTEAFNVTIDDPMSAPFSCDEPAAGDIVNGSGDTLAFSGTLASGIQLSASLRGNDGSVGAPYSTDTALMTLRCSLDGSVEPRQSYANEAGVIWTSVPDPALPFTRISDTAEVVIADPEISKRVVTIAPGYSANALEAHIGELITYEVVIAVPEGTSSRVRLQDILQNGLAAVDVLSLSTSSSTLSTSEGSFTDVLANLGFNSQGGGVTAPDRRLVFGPANNDSGFGTITNSDTNNVTAETITLRYRARVLNASINVQNRRRINRARWLWQPTGSGRRNVEARADRVRIVEPSLALSKSLAPDEGDVNSPPRVTLSFEHQGGSRGDAFDVELSDALPTNLFVDGAIDTSACPSLPDFPGFLLSSAADSLSASWAEFPRGASCTISFQTRFDTNPLAGERFTNCANLRWESLRDSDQPLATPPNNTLGVERTGDPSDPGQQNNYNREACDVFAVFDVGISKNLLSTDQAHTDSINGTPPGFESLTIGELATFELVITIPDANVTELRVTDLLPVTDNVLELVSTTTTFVGSDLTADFPSGNPVSSDRDSDGVLDQASFNFGSITQLADGSTDEDDRIRIEIVARVKDRLVNENNDQTANDAVVRFDGLTASDRFELEVVEPVLLISKSGDRSEAEAGDAVTYTILVEHSASSRVDAQDVELEDLVPPELNVIAGSVTLGDTCTSAPTSGPSLSAGTVAASWTALPLGDSCEIEFQATVDISAITGQSITNEAELRWTSRSGTGASDDRQYDNSDFWLIGISEPGLEKALTATDLDATDFTLGEPSQDLSIGETATFTLTADFSDGTSENVVLRDQLPTNDVVLEITGSRIVSIGADLSIASGLTVGDPAADCSTGTPQSCAEWVLGDVVNQPDVRPEPDLDDSVVVEIDARVVDDPSNSGAPGEDKNLLNEARLSGTNINLLATESFDLVEPILEFSKFTVNGALPAIVVAGGTQRFTLEVQHAAESTAAATDLLFTDVLDAEIFWVDDSTVASDCPEFTIDSSPAPGTTGTVTFTVDELSLLQGGCEISYDVQAAPGLSLPGTFPNSASLTWYSALAANPESRRGDLVASNRLISLVFANLSKVVTGTSVPGTDDAQLTADVTDLAIGERVSYQIVAAFDEGTTNAAQLEDTFEELAPNGPSLEFLAGEVIFVGDNVSTSNPVLSPAPVGNVVSVDFGTVVNIADLVLDQNDTIVFELVARVADLPANVSGVSLNNSVDLDFAGGSASTDINVEIVEPVLGVVKTFTDLTEGVATIEVVLSNSGNSAAYELEFEDAFDETFWTAGSLAEITVPPGFTLSESSSGGTTTVTLQTEGDPSKAEQVLVPGETITVVFTMTLNDGGIVGVTQIDNTVNASTTSLPGIDAAERTYLADASASLFFADLSLEKTWSGPNNPAIPGDTLVYTLTLTNNGQAAATNVSIDDTPDVIADFVTGSVNPSAGGTVLSGNSPDDVVVSATFQTVAASSSVTVEYEVQVPLPYPDSNQPEQLQNQASADSKEQRGILSDDPSTADPLDPTIAPVAADPIMTIAKDDQILTTTAGDTIEYLIQFGNSGNQNATGVVISETVPANTFFDATSSSAGWSCPGGSPAGTECNLSVGDVTVGVGSVIFAVQVADPLPPGVSTINNNVAISDDGLEFDSGAPVIPSTANANEDTPINGAFPELRIEKDDGGTSVFPGQIYSYEIAYSNIGNRGATGIVITETVPLDVNFDATASLPSVWSCPDGSAAGTECSLTVPLLLGGESGQARFGLDVLFPAAAGVDLLVNAVAIEDDGSNSVIPARDEDVDDTPLVAAPDIYVTKAPDVGATNVNESVIYSAEYGNRGNQNATGVLIQETVPVGAVFNEEASLPSAWSCSDGAAAGTVCSFTAGAVDVGFMNSLTFAIDVVTTPDNRQILNVIEGNDDSSNGPDLVPADNIFQVATPFPTLDIDTLSRGGLLLLAALILIMGTRHERLKRRLNVKEAL
ncbi:MAG: hypothetical protein AAF098_14765 [Pseudomonadota bacterium]